MNLDRLSNGQRIASISALLLFVLMFLDWFGTKSSVDSFGLFSVGRSSWEALDYIPVVLLIAIVAALAVAALSLANAFGRASTPANAVVAILGLVSALLILFRVIDPPNFGGFGDPFGPVTYEGTVQFPMFLALLAAVGIAFGGCWAMREGGVSFAELRGVWTRSGR
jgi:uncharacterized membrane protein